MSRAQQWLAASALMPVIGALSRPTHLQALIYTFFVFIYLSALVFEEESREKKPQSPQAIAKEDLAADAPVPLHKGRFLVATIAGGLASTTLAWLSLLSQNQNQLVPYYGQLSADLFLDCFKYAAVAGSWLFLSRKSQYSINQIFAIMFAAALANQAIAGNMSPLFTTAETSPVLAVFILASWYAVDGAIVSMAFICGGRPLLRSKQKADLATCLKAAFLLIILPQIIRLAALQMARICGISHY